MIKSLYLAGLLPALLVASGLPDPGSAQSIGWFILALAGVCVALNNILKLFDRFRGKAPQPPNDQLGYRVHAVETKVSKVETTVKELATDTKHEFDQVRRDASERTAGLYTKIDQVEQRINHKTEEQTRELTRLIINSKKNGDD